MSNQYEVYIVLDNVKNIEKTKSTLSNKLNEIEHLSVEDSSVTSSMGLNSKEIGLSFIISIAASLAANQLQDSINSTIKSNNEEKELIIKVSITDLGCTEDSLKRDAGLND